MMKGYRGWMKVKKKNCLRILAVMLSLCVLITTNPDVWSALSVFAAEGIEENGSGSIGEESKEGGSTDGTSNDGSGVGESGDTAGGSDDGSEAGEGGGAAGGSDDGNGAGESGNTAGGSDDGSETGEGGDTAGGSDDGNGAGGSGNTAGGTDEGSGTGESGGATGGTDDGSNAGGSGDTAGEGAGDGLEDTEPDETTDADDSESEDTGLLPEGESLSENSVPMGENILRFLQRAKALPDLEAMLEDAPGEEEGYEAWEECFLEAVTEAEALRKEYDAFTEAEQSQIPEEIYTNLVAWWEYAQIMGETDLYAEPPVWGGTGYAPVRGYGASGSTDASNYGVYALGNDLTFKAGEGDKTKVYYTGSDTPIDLADLEEKDGAYSFVGEGDAASGFDLTNSGVVSTWNGNYTGYQDESGALVNVFKDKDMEIRIEGGILLGLLNVYVSENRPKSITLHMTGGTWLGGTAVQNSIIASAAYVSGGYMKGSIKSWSALYLSEAPVIGEEGGGLWMSSGSKFYLNGSLSSGADIYINPQADFADGSVVAEGSGYTIQESDLAYLHLTGDNIGNRELKLVNNQILLVLHTHTLSYTASGKVITETCAADDCDHSATATLSIKEDVDLTYTGSALKPATVTYSDNWAGLGVNKPDDTQIVYANNINAGNAATASLIIAEQTANLTFSISPRDISDASVTLNSTSLTYNGAEQKKGVNSVTVNGRTLTAGTDYTVSGNKGTDAKTYTMTLTGKGNYIGTKTADFTIAPKSLSANMITVAAGPHYYTGNAIMPGVTVKDGSRTLVKNTDYTVGYENNTNAGEGTVKVEGKGNYTGTVSRTFTIQYSPLPADKKLSDFVTVSPAPADGWYSPEITLSPKSGCGVGETPSDIGSTGVTVSDETGASGSTKTVYIKDGSGNVYQTTFTYKLDKTPPVIDLSHLSVTNGKSVWSWIIGKTDMIIHIPEADITDALSGIKEVTYTAVSDSGAQKSGEIHVKSGYYEISLNGEFSGIVKLTAKDKAGNATEVSLTTAGGKVIAEDYAPVVKITLPDTPTPNENGWYNTQVSVNVAVTDDKDNSDVGVISGGIAQIVWKDGENGREQTVSGLPGNSPVYKKEFTISVSTDGVHTYYVKATDNAGNESGWQTVTVKCDTGSPVFSKNPAAVNLTQEGADITFTPSEGGKVYWLVDAPAKPDAQQVVDEGGKNGCVKEEIAGGAENAFAVTGLQPGERHTVYVVLADAAGNLSEVREVSFTALQAAPNVALDDLIIDHAAETIKVPDSVGEVEVYTDPVNPEGSRITPDADGFLPVEPGTSVYIRYPEKREDGEVTPPGDSERIDIPGRPAAPAPKQVTMENTEEHGVTVTVTAPHADEEYILVEKGVTPDWSNPSATGEFIGMDPGKEYDLWVRKKATDSNFASDPVKTEIRTPVTVKSPVVAGEGAGKSDNTAPKPTAPDPGNETVTFTGTYAEEYTPVIKVGGQEITPVLTWDEGTGKGEWKYPYPISDDTAEVEITVEFRKRKLTAITVTPGSLTIHADHAANRSAAEAGNATPLTAWLEEECKLKAAYDNKTEASMQGASYTTTNQFVPKGGVYNYVVSAEGKTAGITLTVAPVNAAVTAPDKVVQIKKSGGYTQAEVAAWLPAQLTVTYTGSGYTTKTEKRAVTWNTASIGADFGGTLGVKTLSGTVDLPTWATGQADVNIGIEFTDKMILMDAQMTLSVSGWTYGAQEQPDPRGSVSVTDTNPVITYLYSADRGTTWAAAERLPKSSSGHIVPGAYQVKMTYTGDGYIGTKTAGFTVEKRPLTVEKGTLEAETKNYDGTLVATLKEGGKPALAGVLTGDTVSVGGTLHAEFAEAGPKKNVSVTVTGFELAGRDAGCYSLGNDAVTLQATINKADGTPPSDGKKPGGGNKDKDKDKDKENDGDRNNGDTNESGEGNGGLSDNGSQPIAGNPPKNPAKETDASPSVEEGQQTGETEQPSAAQRKPERGDNSEREPGGQAAQETTEKPGERKEQEGSVAATEKLGGQDTTGTEDGRTVKELTVTVDEGKLVAPDKDVSAGNVVGMEQTSTAMMLGEGTVFVMVVCEEEKYTAGVRDTAAVANAVLSPEHIQLVNDGESIEIRVDVKDISQLVPQQDKDIIESGLVKYQEEVPDLVLGRYVDISMFMRLGKGDWDAITSTEEPIEVVIGIPEDMQEEDRAFYIIRAHEGEHTFLRDLDEEPDTITISTDMFSSYAIAYAAAGANNVHKCGLCHICPTFLGICCFIWLVVVIAAFSVIAVVILRRKKNEFIEK